MVKGPDKKRVICNTCVSVVSIIANQAYLQIFDDDDDTPDEDLPFVDEELPVSEAEIEDFINSLENGELPFSNKTIDEEEHPFIDKLVEDSAPKKLLPKDIMAFLNKHIIGQDKAKKTLAVAIYNHAKRLKDKTGLIRKSNILMVGPSGTGKTLLAQTLAKVLDVPFAIADATSLTEAGYVGDDVENVLVRLIQAADGDIKKAERGIVYIDEIDKIARKSENRSITRDVSGEGVQHALLKIIEGAEVSVPTDGRRKHPHGDNVMINTKNILFICGGAFEGLATKEEKKCNHIGFGASEEAANEITEPSSDELTADQLVKYGMTPELMGRLPVIVQLEGLKEEDLVRILTEPQGALTKEYEALLEADGVKLVFEQDALLEIAKTALDRHTGARGLRSIMEELMLDIMYDLPDENEESRTCIITKETVLTKQPIVKAA
jgi:ATP-dependent Clp protease ATP-binding subunit ClpX